MCAPLAIPLAWRNLTHSGKRFWLSIAGIAFAVGMMFTQLGFYFALTDSMTRLLRAVGSDAIVIARARKTLNSPDTFDRGSLDRLRSDPDVAAAWPLYLETVAGTLNVSGTPPKPVRVIGFDPTSTPIRLSETTAEPHTLFRPDAAWIDVSSKPYFEGIGTSELELAGRRVELVGRFDLGTDFVNDGNLAMSPRVFADYFAYRAPFGNPLSRVDLGLFDVRPGADAGAVCDRLQRTLGRDDDLTILTTTGLMQRERDYWNKSTPIGYIFSLGLVIGFGVGIAICYQIIFAGLAELQAEFATLKAIGYANAYLVRQVLEQSLYLSFIGYAFGLVLTWLLFAILGQWSGLPMELSMPRVLSMYGVTLVMCLISGGLAVRKVLKLDPADLF